MSKIIKHPLADRREKRSTAGLVLGPSIFLILVSFLLRYLTYRSHQLTEEYNLYYTNEHIAALMTTLLIAVLIEGIVSWIFPRAVSTETVIRLSLPFYLVVIVLGIIKAMTSYSAWDRWLRIGPITLYVPAMFALGIFAVSYYVCKYKNYGIWYAAVIAFTAVFIPCFIAGIGLRSLSISVELFITFMVLSARLSKDGRLSQSWGHILTIFIVLWIASVILLFFMRHDLFVERLTVGLTGGEADPTGTGLAYILLRKGIGSAKFVGMSGYQISSTEPVWQYFAKADTAYAPALILFRFGWLALGLVLAAVTVLIKNIYGLAFRAGNSYARYFSYSVASFFLVRLFLGLISCFVLILSNANLPFQGSTSYTLVDIILVNFAVALCGKADSSDLIDRDHSTSQMLNLLEDDLKTRLKERMRSLIGADLDEDEWEDYLLDEDEALPRRYRDRVSYDDRVQGLQREMGKLRQEIRDLKRDKAALENENITLLEIQKKYASSLVWESAADNVGTDSSTSAKKEKRSKIFISYNQNDRRIAHMISDLLENQGYETWYFNRDILADSYAKKILEALRATKIFIVVITRSSNKSEHVANEVALAFEMIQDGLTIMPIIIDDIALSDNLHYFLCRQELTNATTPPVERQIQKFVQKVATVMEDD